MTKSTYSKLMTSAKDYAMILLGLFIYAIGFCAFILPHNVVVGGMAGLGTLVYFATNKLIPVAVTMYGVNIILVTCGYKMLGRSFTIRTIFGATAASLWVGMLEEYFISHPPLLTDAAMSIVLGGILMGIGIGTGDNRASDAASMAINSPLLERSIDGAKGIIINITGNEDLGLFEINEASQIITEAADPDANIIWGTSVDDTLDNDTVRITVIATGFGEKKKAQAPAQAGNRFSNAVRPSTGIAVPEFLRK